jgi:hypothetical protein
VTTHSDSTRPGAPSPICPASQQESSPPGWDAGAVPDTLAEFVIEELRHHVAAIQAEPRMGFDPACDWCRSAEAAGLFASDEATS